MKFQRPARTLRPRFEINTAQKLEKLPKKNEELTSTGDFLKDDLLFLDFFTLKFYLKFLCAPPHDFVASIKKILEKRSFFQELQKAALKFEGTGLRV